MKNMMKIYMSVCLVALLAFITVFGVYDANAQERRQPPKEEQPRRSLFNTDRPSRAMPGMTLQSETATPVPGDVAVDVIIVNTPNRVEDFINQLIFLFSIENTSDKNFSNLYMYFDIKYGGADFIELKQEKRGTGEAARDGFSLNGMQIVDANNMMMFGGNQQGESGTRIPGISENFYFETIFHRDGDEEQGISLEVAAGVYDILFKLYYTEVHNNIEIASSTGRIVIDEGDPEITLDTPIGGDPTETTLPTFQWESNLTSPQYIFLLVDNSEEGQNLLNQQGTIDVPVGTQGLVHRAVTSNTSLAYSTNFLPLLAGENYTWQIRVRRELFNRVTIVTSDVETFVVPSAGGSSDTGGDEGSSQEEMIQEILGALAGLLDAQDLEDLEERLREDFTLHTVRVDGSTFGAAAALGQLKLVKEKLDNGEIEIIE